MHSALYYMNIKEAILNYPVKKLGPAYIFCLFENTSIIIWSDFGLLDCDTM